MAIHHMSEFVQQLRRAVLGGQWAALTDGQLLERFLSRRDPAAIEAIVLRHGAMVWGVCRRILSEPHDAEDAFQATFLVLVRKAASIVPREMVGNWLYGVAQQTARKARAMTAKRRTREKQMAAMPEPAVVDDKCRRDLQDVLDQELARMPDTYRACIVLCDLEGKSRKEAARQLDWPEGTVASRLARGRTMLAKRMARHGFAASGGALATLLTQHAVAAPPAVVSSTTQAVSLAAAGQATTGIVSAKVVCLTEGVVKVMLLSKLKTPLALLLGMLVLLGFSIGLEPATAPNPAAANSRATPKNKSQPDAPATPKPAANKKEKAKPPPADNDWSKPVDGLQARLSFGKHSVLNGTPVLAPRLELRNITENAEVMVLPFDEIEFEFKVTNSAGEIRRTTSGPFNELTAPVGDIRLPHDSSVQLNIRRTGYGVRKDHAAHLDLGADHHWVFERPNTETYYLEGKMTVKLAKARNWSGTIQLPKVKIPIPPAKPAEEKN